MYGEERAEKPLSPVMRQYHAAKSAHPDSILFFRMGDFYEMFHDDAVVATNALEITFFLDRSGCEVESVACTDRYVAKLPDFLLNLTPLRFWMFNAFVVARRIR